MPSDAAKKRQAQKREQRKQASSRAAQKKAHVPPGPGPDASSGSAQGIEKKPVSDGARASNDSSVSVTKLTDRAAALKVTQTARSCTGEDFCHTRPVLVMVTTLIYITM